MEQGRVSALVDKRERHGECCPAQLVVVELYQRLRS